jgi:hypothetical protein
MRPCRRPQRPSPVLLSLSWCNVGTDHALTLRHPSDVSQVVCHAAPRPVRYVGRHDLPIASSAERSSPYLHCLAIWPEWVGGPIWQEFERYLILPTTWPISCNGSNGSAACQAAPPAERAGRPIARPRPIGAGLGQLRGQPRSVSPAGVWQRQRPLAAGRRPSPRPPPGGDVVEHGGGAPGRQNPTPPDLGPASTLQGRGAACASPTRERNSRAS